jgi:cytochrome P450
MWMFDRNDEHQASPPGRITPPAPEPAAETLSASELAAAFRTNALRAWSHHAFEADVVERRFFGRHSVLLNAPDAIRRVLVDNHANYGRTPATIRILRPVAGEGLFLSRGEAWRHQRRTVAPALTPKAVDVLVPHVLSAAREAIVELDARRDRPVDLLNAMQHLALEIAGRTMFSLEMQRHGAKLRDLLARYNRRLGRPHLLDLVLPVTLPSPHDFARWRFRRIWMSFIEGIMTERLRSDREGAAQDLFDLLVAARDPETGDAFSPAQLRDQVATMILAGHETTAVALFWSLYLLALAPSVQDRVAAEASSITFDATDEAMVPRLVYTRAVLDEVLRLYPPAFAIVREALGPDRVHGVSIRRGALVVVAPWVLHRHRQLWSEPNVFDPERFLPGAAPINRFAYLPFGVGPRVCIGAHFALTEATLVLAALIRAFRVQLVDHEPVVPVAIITTQPDRSPAFRLHRR